eukprot:6448018-Pyramimonas_sp.AAC.1
MVWTLRATVWMLRAIVWMLRACEGSSERLTGGVVVVGGTLVQRLLDHGHLLRVALPVDTHKALPSQPPAGE